jgi:hypothetical protein
MVDRYRLTDTGQVLTKDELRQRLTAELDAMDPETRAANCVGTVDDLIADSVLVGIYERVDEEDEPSVVVDSAHQHQRAELAAELGFIPASLGPAEIERHRQLNAATDSAQSQEHIMRNYAHLREEKRRAQVEVAGRAAIASHNEEA